MKFVLVIVFLIAIVTWQASVLANAEDERVVTARQYYNNFWGARLTCVVLVTLKNRERLVLNKVPKGKGFGVVEITTASSITGWTPIGKATKQIANSTFLDYVRAAGTGYNYYSDGVGSACARMMALN